jgi:GT2 family glycosyltransferase
MLWNHDRYKLHSNAPLLLELSAKPIGLHSTLMWCSGEGEEAVTPPHTSLGSDSKIKIISSRQNSGQAARVLAIIVVYKISPAECPTLQSLMASFACVVPQELQFKVLIYDNTEGGQEPGMLPEGVEYYAATYNDGLANAYNFALSMAQTAGFDWLLTLDQDTELPKSFLPRIAGIVRDLGADIEIAGVVPLVCKDSIVISPRMVRRGRSKNPPRGFVGVLKGEITAINSATTWRVHALKEIGGFNPLFWLDYLDYWLCHIVHQAGKRIYVAGDIKVVHDLSLLGRKNNMSSTRFSNFLQAESAFYDLHKGRLDRCILTARLFARLCRQIIRHENVEFRRLTFGYILRQIRDTPANRIEDWKKSVTKRTSRGRTLNLEL